MKEPKISRRGFLKTLAVAGALTGIGTGKAWQKSAAVVSIDRAALVNRYSPVLRRLDPLSPVSVGNGEFAFTADITGLQTFPREYENQMPLCTRSQ